MSYRFLVIALALVTTTASCVPVPLGDPDKSKVRKEYVGLWLGPDGYLFDVQQFDSRAYLIDWMQFDSSTGKPSKRFLVKGWITEIKGTQFVTLKVFPVDAANNPAKSGDQVTIGRIEMKKGQLLVSLFKHRVFKNVSTTAQLRGILEKRHKDADIYENATKFERVKKTDKRAKAILRAFHRK